MKAGHPYRLAPGSDALGVKDRLVDIGQHRLDVCRVGRILEVGVEGMAYTTRVHTGLRAGSISQLFGYEHDRERLLIAGFAMR